MLGCHENVGFSFFVSPPPFFFDVNYFFLHAQGYQPECVTRSE